MREQQNGAASSEDEAPIILSLQRCPDGPIRDSVQRLAAFFRAKFGADPKFFVKVPGRVNLIGEHIDYCGYGVCPMALEQHILLAVDATEEPLLRLANEDQHKYSDFETHMSSLKFEVVGAPRWHEYFLCGVRGVVEEVGSDAPLGMRIAVTGTVPPSSGLSSSSALVCAAALATARVLQAEMGRRELAALSARCERFVGTEGGGMDQAIAFLGTSGCAKLIEFEPLRSKSLRLPQGAVFVIAHSLAEMNKAATADFNCRVVECRLASQIIAKVNGLEWRTLTKLANLQKELGKPLKEMAQLVRKHLHPEPYTMPEVYFCSPSCKSRAWRKFHEHECAAAATLLEATVGDDVDGEDVLLALRIVCTAGLEQLRPFVASGVPGCLTDGRYFPNLGAVLQLESNLERLARDHLQQGCRLALHLAKCLGAPEEYAGVLLRIILGLDSNCHSLREMVRRPGRSPLFQVIGCALYPSAALCNHSCDPNLFRATHGNCTVHRARRLIRAGEMLTECYKSLFVHAPRRDRRTYCKLFYYFECGCEACVHDWPLLEDLPERPVFGKGETRLWSEFKRQLDELESQPGAQGDDVIPKQQLTAHVQLLNFLVTNDKRLCRLSFHLEKQIQNFYSAQGNCYFKTGEE